MLASRNVRFECWHCLAQLLAFVAVQGACQQCMHLRCINAEPAVVPELLQHKGQMQEEGTGEGEPVLLVLELVRNEVLQNTCIHVTEHATILNFISNTACRQSQGLQA